MSVPVLSLWNRIQAFIAALLSGLIFLVAGITDVPVFGQTYIEFVLKYFPWLDAGTQAALSQTLSIMMLIADFTGLLILVAAVLILLGRVRIAGLILFFIASVGIFAFAVPIFTAMIQGVVSLEIALNSVSTKYALAALFAMLARSYVKKA